MISFVKWAKMNSFDNKLFLCACKLLTLCIVIQSLWTPTVLSAESTGQKAHFQVEDKSGDLKISATKDLAKVTAQADSVQVVVKPGTAEYPVLKSDKPIVHITQPGWQSMSFRKSAIFKTKIPDQARKPDDGRTKKVSKKRVAPVHLKSFELGQRQRKVFLKHGSSSLRHFTHRDQQDELTGSKKSDVKYSGFHVAGNAGKLKMHVTKDETTLDSESGGVDISLNKPPSSSSTSTSNQRSFQAQPEGFREKSGDKMIHIASELENNMSFIGLRKSVVTKLKTDWD